jgi:transcriptional regulator with XRE-family HTH domain
MTSKPGDPFSIRFCERTRAIREAMGWSQKEMAHALGIPLENYKKYEKRTPIPHRLITRYCLITGVSEADLFDLDKAVDRLPLRRPAGQSGHAKGH